MDNSEAGYTFTVSATNKAGTSGTSAQSAAVRAVGKPAMVGQPSATLVDTGGDGGKIDVRFTALTADQRNGSSAGEITYKYRLTSGGGSGNIPAGGGVVAAANGTATAVVVWAVSSRSSSAGDASPASNSVNPYGLAFAPAVTGASSSGVGDKTVSWTWTQPNGNGRPVTGYQYSLDGGSWQQHRAAFLLQGRRLQRNQDAAGPRHQRRPAGPDRQRHLPQRLGTAAAGPHVPDPGGATTVRTCPGKPNQTDTYSEGPPKTCGAGWVERSEGRLTINCTKDIYGNGTPWFRVTEGSHPGWFVKSTTVDLYGPRPGGC